MSNPPANSYHSEEMIQCPKCSIRVKATKLEKHLRKCGNQIKSNPTPKKVDNIPLVLNLNIKEPLSIDRKNQLLNNQKNISCPYCSKTFSKINGVFSHIQAKHSEHIFEFLEQEEVKILLGNLIQCKYCNLFFEDTKLDMHLKKCSKYKEEKNQAINVVKILVNLLKEKKIDISSNLTYKESLQNLLDILLAKVLASYDEKISNNNFKEVNTVMLDTSIKVLPNGMLQKVHYRRILKTLLEMNNIIDMSSRVKYKESMQLILDSYFEHMLLAYKNQQENEITIKDEISKKNEVELYLKDDVDSPIDGEMENESNIVSDMYTEKLAYDRIINESEDQISSPENTNNKEIKTLDKEAYWEENSPIKEPTTIDNVLKHKSDTFQYKDGEELDPDMIIDEEQYQEEFINNLSNNKVNIVKTERVVFQKSIVDKEEKDLKSDIKIFLSKMYKGYCQVCGFTFKKLNGDNSFEMFNWNDKRVVKIKKSFISTADSLCLCRNCSANIKWGAFKPVFIDKIKNIEDFQDTKSDEIKIILHNIVDKEVPNIFKNLLDFGDMYALEIELRKEPLNIYFTNEHLLQFIAYLQTEDEIVEELLFKKTKRKINDVSNRIYSDNTWLRREETIPESLAKEFIRNTTWWDHPKAYRYVRANHSHRVKKDYRHGWAIKFGANQFLVGKAIERCKDEINKYIEQLVKGNKMDFYTLKEQLRKHISGAVATGNNYEYNGYYPIQNGYMKFGVQAINVDDGVNFLIRELGLDEFIEKSII